MIISLFEIASIAFIGPYIGLLADTEISNGIFHKLINYFGFFGERTVMLTSLGILLVIIFALKSSFVIFINAYIIRFSLNLQIRLRSLLMQSYQQLPYRIYLERNSSEYIYSIQSLTTVYSSLIAETLRSSSEIIVGLGIISILAWTNFYALIFFIVLLGIIVFGYDLFFKEKLKKFGSNINRNETAMMQGINEGIEGLKEIRVLGVESYFFKKMHKAALSLNQNLFRQQVIQTAPRFLLEFFIVLFVILLVIGVVFLGNNQKELLPTLGIFGVAAVRLLPSTNMLSGCLVRFRFSRDAVSRLHDDFKKVIDLNKESFSQIQKSQPVSNKSDVLTNSFNSLELKNLIFRYPNSLKDAIQGISLRIHAGESVGFIGASGAGKTTLVNLLLGLLEPQSGIINYNGKSLIENIEVWRNQTAYLPQDIFLIDNSLKSNVALGFEDEDIEDKRLKEALGQARLSELVSQLPKGVDTLLGEHGTRLSGGQRQRVAMARAFYHRRGVLVMDESTSSLDHETEREIVEEIKHLKGSITLIVIAHRLTTVEHCDRIYRLENGLIVEEGSPEQLFSKVS